MKYILFVRKWKEYTALFFVPKRSIRHVSILSRVTTYSPFSTYPCVILVGKIYMFESSANFVNCPVSVHFILAYLRPATINFLERLSTTVFWTFALGVPSVWHHSWIIKRKGSFDGCHFRKFSLFFVNLCLDWNTESHNYITRAVDYSDVFEALSVAGGQLGKCNLVKHLQLQQSYSLVSHLKYVLQRDRTHWKMSASSISSIWPA